MYSVRLLRIHLEIHFATQAAVAMPSLFSLAYPKMEVLKSENEGLKPGK